MPGSLASSGCGNAVVRKQCPAHAMPGLRRASPMFERNRTSVVLRGQTTNDQPGCYSRVRRVLSSELCWLRPPGEDHLRSVASFLCHASSVTLVNLATFGSPATLGADRAEGGVRYSMGRHQSSALWRLRVMETRARCPVTRRSPRANSRCPAVRAGARGAAAAESRVLLRPNPRCRAVEPARPNPRCRAAEPWGGPG